MDQTEAKILAIAGLLINSALYLGGVIAAGLVVNDALAWRMGLVSAALCYVGYFLQLSAVPRKLAALVVISSIITGAIAGVALLV